MSVLRRLPAAGTVGSSAALKEGELETLLERKTSGGEANRRAEC